MDTAGLSYVDKKRHLEQTRARVWSRCFVSPTISLSIFRVKPPIAAQFSCRVIPNPTCSLIFANCIESYFQLTLCVLSLLLGLQIKTVSPADSMPLDCDSSALMHLSLSRWGFPCPVKHVQLYQKYKGKGVPSPLDFRAKLQRYHDPTIGVSPGARGYHTRCRRNTPP